MFKDSGADADDFLGAKRPLRLKLITSCHPAVTLSFADQAGSGMTKMERSEAPKQDVWRHAIDRAKLGLWDWHLQTDRCYYSASWFEMLGYSEDELPQTTDLWLSLTHPDDRERAIRSGEGHLSGALGSIETELRMRHKCGRWIWVLDRGGVIEWDSNGRPLRAVGIQTDITRQKEVEGELAQANEQNRLALEASGLGSWHFDVDTQHSVWDTRTREIFGLKPGAGLMPPGSWHSFLHPDDAQRAEREHNLPLATHLPNKVSYRIIRRDGTVRHVETLCIFVEVSGTKGRLVGTTRDTTAEVEEQRKLALAASQDSLTGLLNRAAFETRLAKKIGCAATEPFALFYVDLDYFKALNDSLGHAAGDAALRQIANSFRAALPAAVVARLGGDEFAIVLDLTDAEPAHAAETLLSAVRQVANFGVGGHHPLGASIGVAVIASEKTEPADALARADDACYTAKSSGRNRWVLEKDASQGSGLTAGRLVADLAAAMDEGRVKLFGQEIRYLDQPHVPTGRVEVLARLISPAGILISPAEFIPAAERFGMAAVLDRHIIRKALKQLGDRSRSGPNITLGINLSAHTLSDPLLWQFVEVSAEEFGAPLSQLVFEITETAALTNVEAAERFVRKARDKGCRVSLDDFGAGMSSFSYLRRFAVDSIKIDGSFIENIATSQFDREVVRSICGISKSLRLIVIAERIECLESLKILTELGVSLGQGFALHRPEPLEHLLNRISPAV